MYQYNNVVYKLKGPIGMYRCIAVVSIAVVSTIGIKQELLRNSWCINWVYPVMRSGQFPCLACN